MFIHRFTAGILASLCIGFLPLGTWAASPANGTLSPPNSTLTTQGGPYTAANPSGSTGTPQCSGQGATVCDSYQLTLDIPQDWRNANPDGDVNLSLNWSRSGDNYNLYLQDSQGNTLAASQGKGAKSFGLPVSNLPNQLKVVVVPTTATGSTYSLAINLTDECSSGGSASNGSASSTASVDPGVLRDWQGLADTSTYGAFVQFGSGTVQEQNTLLAQTGLETQADFRRYSRSVFATGPVAAFRALALQPSVTRIEYNQPLKLAGYTGSWTTRARYAQEAVAGGPYLDASGNSLTGNGITVGLIDSGLYGSHPDFANRVIHQYKLGTDANGAPTTFSETYTTADTEDSKGGHGTHVAGIMAGGGQSSDGNYPSADAAPAIRGSFTGVAPGANIAVWAIGAQDLSLYNPALAFQHLLNNLDGFQPALRVVNNSYIDYAGATYNPSSTMSCLVKAAVKRNVVVVFAAGNDGGDGSSDETSSFCKDPTPGVICVASVNDGGTGNRTLGLSSFSSRGKQGDATTYPDIAAPGENITSTCMEGQSDQVVCTNGEGSSSETSWQPWYGTISGTSMAAPHVTGAVALILQAHPELTPAQVEQLLQDAALKVGSGYESDPQNPGGTVNVGFGAGLLDVAAAFDSLKVTKQGLPAAGTESTIFEGDVDNAIAPAADARALTLQNATISGAAGVMARVTLADAGNFGSEGTLSYALTLDAGGNAYSITVTADASGIRSAGAASFAVREGNVLRFFVPSSQLGNVKSGDVLDHIRVLVSDANGVLDYAPSPAGGNRTSDALNPMFGRGFTLQTVAEVTPSSSGSAPVTTPGSSTTSSSGNSAGSGGGGSAGGALMLGLLALVRRAQRRFGTRAEKQNRRKQTDAASTPGSARRSRLLTTSLAAATLTMGSIAACCFAARAATNAVDRQIEEGWPRNGMPAQMPCRCSRIGQALTAWIDGSEQPLPVRHSDWRERHNERE